MSKGMFVELGKHIIKINEIERFYKKIEKEILQYKSYTIVVLKNGTELTFDGYEVFETLTELLRELRKLI